LHNIRSFQPISLWSKAIIKERLKKNTTDHVTRINDFNQIVLGRRSIKKYDPSIKISREEMSEMLSKATRAPSSINLQPWRFLVIESEEQKQNCWLWHSLTAIRY
jgi:hypothetical protein